MRAQISVRLISSITQFPSTAIDWAQTQYHTPEKHHRSLHRSVARKQLTSALDCPLKVPLLRTQNRWAGHRHRDHTAWEHPWFRCACTAFRWRQGIFVTDGRLKHHFYSYQFAKRLHRAQTAPTHRGSASESPAISPPRHTQ